MGIIKDGSISGVLPCNDAFAIHFPGYPSSKERAIQCLGGTEGIQKARSSQSNKLELYFRPEDPYSHPVFGELQHCNCFLLKISKNNCKDSQSAEDPNMISKCSVTDPINPGKTLHEVSQSENGSTVVCAESKTQIHSEEQGDLSADVVGRVSEAYYFSGMVDYQHVPAVHSDVLRKKKRHWADIEPQFNKGGLMNVDGDDLMILVPPLFSPKDMPEKIVLRPSVNLSSKKKQGAVVDNPWEMDIEPGLALDFNIKEVPRKSNWEKYMPQGSEQWKWQMAVCKLFDEHPIWVKDSITERLHDEGMKIDGVVQIRKLLFMVAYYFSNGPFLRFWIRRGYDPRKDPGSRKYQRIDFRVPPPLRRYCETSMASGLKHRWEDVCAFRVFPYKCQTYLQLFELTDDYIQQEIEKPTSQSTCSCATGWFSSRVLNSMRLRIATRFLSVYPQSGAESFLKSALRRFEKSKRIQTSSKDLQLEGGQQELNKVMAGYEDKLPSEDDNKEEDTDEDDEIEDDIVQEELDAYEALVADDERFSLQQCSYADGENMSRNYLQELFGSFPLSEAGSIGLEDGDNSDGEYQIYERYSDGNYSDDDDY